MGRCCTLMNVTGGASPATARVVDDVTELEEQPAIDGASAEMAASRSRASTAAYSQRRRPGNHVMQPGLSEMAPPSTRRGRQSGHVAWASLPSAHNERDERRVETVASPLDKGIRIPPRYSCAWPGGVMVKALARHSRRREFNSRPSRCQVTTLGKLFTHMCLCHQAV